MLLSFTFAILTSRSAREFLSLHHFCLKLEFIALPWHIVHTHMYVCAFADVQYLLFGAKKPLPACQILQFLSIIYDQCIGYDF